MDSAKWAKKNNIKTINFLLYKPIKSYSYSIWKRGESLEAALHRYKSYYMRFFQSGLKAYAVNYDTLVNQPQKTLDELVAITGQVNNKKRANFWEKEHHHLFGSDGTRKQSRNASSEIKNKEEYPAEFETVFKQFQAKIKNDQQLNTIINHLNAMGISKSEWKPEKQAIIQPWWYYYLKVKNKVAYYFPSGTTKV